MNYSFLNCHINGCTFHISRLEIKHLSLTKMRKLNFVACVAVFLIQATHSSAHDLLGEGGDLLKLLISKLTHEDVKDKIFHHGLGETSLIADAELPKLITVLLAKKKLLEHGLDSVDFIDHSKFGIEEGLWNLVKGFGTKELAELIPLLLIKAKAFHPADSIVTTGLLDAGKHFDKGILDSLKGIETTELIKLLPVILGEGLVAGDIAVKDAVGSTIKDAEYLAHGVGDLAVGSALKGAKDLALGTAVGAGGLALKGDILGKIISLVTHKDPLDILHHHHDDPLHDILHFDDSIWHLLKGLKAAEVTKLLPVLLGEKLDLLGHKHGVLDISDDLWDCLKVLEPEILAKVLPLIIGGGIEADKLTKILPLVLGKGAVDLLDHHHYHHHLFDFDDSIWGFLKGLKAAEVVKLLPSLLGKEKLELLGFGDGLLHLDEGLWEVLKDCEVPLLVKLLPLVLGKAKVLEAGSDLTLTNPVVKLIINKGDRHVLPRDDAIDWLRHHAVNVQADDCYGYYDDSGFYYYN